MPGGLNIMVVALHLHTGAHWRTRQLAIRSAAWHYSATRHNITHEPEARNALRLDLLFGTTLQRTAARGSRESIINHIAPGDIAPAIGKQRYKSLKFGGQLEENIEPKVL